MKISKVLGLIFGVVILLGLALIAILNILLPNMENKLTVKNQMDVEVCVNGMPDAILTVPAKSEASLIFKTQGDGGFHIFECESGRSIGRAGYFSYGFASHHEILIDEKGLVSLNVEDFSIDVE